MGLLNMSNAVFDPLVERATSEENTSEDWAVIMDICDRVTIEPSGPKDCLRSIVTRLNSKIPCVVMQSLTLVDALVNNCGKKVHLEVASRDFENELRRLISAKSTPHAKVSERARLMLKKWAQEFKNDPQLNLIPSLYEKLKSEGVDFSSSEPRRNRVPEAILKNPDAVTSNQEEADIAKAIELSLLDAQRTPSQANKSYNSSVSSTLYPSINAFDSKSNNSSSNGKASKEIKVRALYDFEAAEDNELTFKAGEIIIVQDNSDANWWKGVNHRGEGLFPANFVTTDLDAEPEPTYKSEKKVQFNEEVKVKVMENDKEQTHEASNGPTTVEIDENKIDRLLHLLQEADPQSEKCDSEELLSLEEQCISMMPLIDQQIELIDKRHASLNTLNQQLSSALNLYHELMKESLMMDQMLSNVSNNIHGQYQTQVGQIQGSPQVQPPMTVGGGAAPAPYSIPYPNPMPTAPPNGAIPYQTNSSQANLNTITETGGTFNNHYYGTMAQPQPYPPQHAIQSPVHPYTGGVVGIPPPNVAQMAMPTSNSSVPATSSQPPLQQQPQQLPPQTAALPNGPYQPIYHQSPTHPVATAVSTQHQGPYQTLPYSSPANQPNSQYNQTAYNPVMMRQNQHPISMPGPEMHSAMAPSPAIVPSVPNLL